MLASLRDIHLRETWALHQATREKVSTAAVFITAPKLETIHMSINSRTGRLWYIHQMESYTEMKVSELQLVAEMWITV